ncbi:MAG: HU family DNA-binding protein [Lachnospiraceae bacterium]
MGMKVQVEKMTLNFTKEKQEVYVARAKRGSVIDTQKLAEDVAVDIGQRPRQVQLVLTSIIDTMVKWMEEGHGVRLDGFGTFLPSVKSDSDPEQDKASVTTLRVTFIPSRELSRRVKAISYSTDGSLATPSAPSTGTPDGGGDDTDLT